MDDVTIIITNHYGQQNLIYEREKVTLKVFAPDVIAI